jgi:hypothetical protein
MAERRARHYVAGGIGLFVFVGIGVGLAQNFTLSFFIEQFVDPGSDPLENSAIGLLLLGSVFTPFTLGPLVAAGVGLVTGVNYPDREGLAALVAGAASGVGFVLMTGLTLFLTFAVLSQYASGGGGGGGGGPFSPADLVPTIVQAGIPMAVVGGGAAYIRARLV